MRKDVSVIIPSYNRAHVLKRTIPTYIQQVTLEIIIVDDGSDDKTQEIVRDLQREFSIIKYVKLKTHKGLPSARNAGLKRAKGNYIFFGDDDAVLYAGTLLRLRDALEQYPADIAGANGSYATELWQTINMEKYILKHFTVPFTGKCFLNFDSRELKYNYKVEKITEGLLVMACFMIKAELTRNVKFDKGYLGSGAFEDIDYLMQQAKKGRKMVYVPDTYEIDIPAKYVKKGGSHNSNRLSYTVYLIRNNNYFLEKHYDYLKRQGYITKGKREAKLYFMTKIIKTHVMDILKNGLN